MALIHSSILVSTAAADPALTAVDRGVYLSIVGAERWTSTKQETLALDKYHPLWGLSRNQLKKAINNLDAAGYIKRGSVTGEGIRYTTAVRLLTDAECLELITAKAAANDESVEG